MQEIPNMFKTYPDVVTIQQLQQMLQIGKNTAYKLLKNNEIPYKKIGNNYKISKYDVIKFISNY